MGKSRQPDEAGGNTVRPRGRAGQATRSRTTQSSVNSRPLECPNGAFKHPQGPGRAEILTEIGVIELATRQSGTIAETPLVPKRRGRECPARHVVEQPQVRPTRYERRQARDRHRRFHDAALFSYAMDWPLTILITISWTALLTAGERVEGHCLARGEWEREAYARNELARLCRHHHLPFVALWGRDIGAHIGSHVHLAMFWPTVELASLVSVLERISGSSAAFVRPPYEDDVAARSVCGGWQINVNRRPADKSSALDLADYIASQAAKHPAPPRMRAKAFGISEAIGKAAQRRARAMPQGPVKCEAASSATTNLYVAAVTNRGPGR